MTLSDIVKDLMGRDVLVITLADRNVGKLTEITDDWIKLTNTRKKGVIFNTVIRIDKITSIAGFSV